MSKAAEIRESRDIAVWDSETEGVKTNVAKKQINTQMVFLFRIIMALNLKVINDFSGIGQECRNLP
jgi:hypothetical protein